MVSSITSAFALRGVRIFKQDSHSCLLSLELKETVYLCLAIAATVWQKIINAKRERYEKM